MGLKACQSAVFRACHSYHSAAGRLVAKRPAASLVASLVVTLLLTACMLLGSWEARLEYRDTLTRSEAFKLFDATLPMFGGTPRTNEYKMSSSDGSNVLTKQAILKALEVDEAVLGLTYKGTRFEDVCLRPYLGGACSVDSAMYRLGLGREEVEALSQEELDSKLLAEYNSNAGGLGSLLGGLTLTDGKLSATSLRFRYFGEPSGQGRPSFVEFVTGTSNDALASATLEWESAFLALVCAKPLTSSGIECATDSLLLGEIYWPPVGQRLSVTGTAQRFIQDEIAANATTSTKWMVVSINLILVLMWLALGGRPLRNSRLTLGTGAVAVILLSVGAGLGFSSLVGVPLTEISLLMVFVIVGVGVDDVIVVVDFLQRQPPHLSIVERISGALGGAGPAIQLTSLTNLIAFLIAATVDFPGVSYFCLSAGFTLFALFLLTTTLFTALLTFDERRRGAMRLDCLCCIGFGAGDSETGDAEPSSPSHKEDDKRAHSGLRAAVSSVARAYDCFVASKPVALVVILAFTSLIPLGFGFAVGNIPLGAELASYFPDGSPYVAYTADTQENFVALDTPGYLVLRDVKWEDASAQTAVDTLLAALESDDFVIAPYSTNNWLAAYRAVAADRGATASAAPPLRQSGDGFLADVAAFLKETDPQCVDRQLGGECLREIIPARYSKEVVWAGEAGASPITATRFSCTLAVPDEVKGRVELMNEHRATADANRGSIDAVVWSYFMLFSDRDRIVVRLVLETLAFAAAAVLGTLVFFLHPLSVAVIALAIASIDGGIFLLMYLWAVPLDAVAFICLAMSIGLSVDYVVHVAHAFEHEEGTPEQRIKAALHGIGWSVLKGGGSTFLGVVALAGADSEIFRTFFKMLFSTVLLGLLAGLVLFPACVIFVGKWITPKLLEKTPAGGAQADAVAKPAAAAEPPALQAQLERY